MQIRLNPRCLKKYLAGYLITLHQSQTILFLKHDSSLCSTDCEWVGRKQPCDILKSRTKSDKHKRQNKGFSPKHKSNPPLFYEVLHAQPVLINTLQKFMVHYTHITTEVRSCYNSHDIWSYHRLDHRVRKKPHTDTTLNQMKPIYAITREFYKFKFNIIRVLKLKSPKWYLVFRISD